MANYPGLGLKPYYNELKAYIQASVGKSAYQVAVDNGYTGTEAEWVASLEGAQGPQGPTGATGPKGDSGVMPGEIPVSQGDLLQGGAASALEPLALPSYGQELRRKGVQLAWGKAKDAHLNDRNDIDATGATDMAAAINAYLAEYYATGVMRVYLDADSRYRVDSTVDIPRAIVLEGPTERGANRYPESGVAAEFWAGADGITMLRTPGWHTTLSGVVINMRNRPDVIGLNPASHYQRIEKSQFVSGHATSTAVKGGALMYFWFLDNSMIGLNGRGVDILNEYASGGYYGVNVGAFKRNVFSGRKGAFRCEGIFELSEQNDFEAGSGSEGPAIELGSSTSGIGSSVTIANTYAEMGGFSQFMLISSPGSYRIRDNDVYGNSAVGSYGVRIAAPYIYHLDVTYNTFNRLDTGLDLAQKITNTFRPHWNLQGNTYNTVTTPITGLPAAHGPASGGVGFTHFAKIGDTLRFLGAVGGNVPYHVIESHGTALDWRRANMFLVYSGSPATLTASNVQPGQLMTIRFMDGTVTLQNSVWRLTSGADETPAAGTVKQFFSDGNSVVREIGGNRPRDTQVKTASFAADAATLLYLVDATAGAVTVTFPDGRTSQGTPAGTNWIVKKTDASANAVNITGGTSTQRFDGMRPLVLARQGDWVWLVSNNTTNSAEVNWQVISGNRMPGALEIDGALDHDGTTAGFFGATPVTKPTALTAADATAIDATYDAAEQAVLENVRTRVNELETKLRALGLLS